MLSRATCKSPLSDDEQACEDHHHSVACSTGSPHLSIGARQHCPPCSTGHMEPLIDDDTPSTATGTPSMHHVLSFIHGDLGPPLEETPRLQKALSQVAIIVATTRPCASQQCCLSRSLIGPSLMFLSSTKPARGGRCTRWPWLFLPKRVSWCVQHTLDSTYVIVCASHRTAGKSTAPRLISTCAPCSKATGGKTPITTQSMRPMSPRPSL